MPEPSLSRRQMLATTLATGAALAGVAPFARSANKSGLFAGPVVIGEGEHSYEVIHDWAKLPPSHAFGNTHGVAVDADGLVHISHTVHASSQSGDAVCVFDPSGAFVRSWGPEYRGGAHGLTSHRSAEGQFLFHADCNTGLVRKTSLTGESVLDFPWPEASGCYAAKAHYKPTNLAIVPHDAGSGGAVHPQAGHVFIADGYGKSWIHEYDASANYLRSFAGPGAERGQTACPHGIMVDTRQGEPRLVVADRSNRRLQYFSLDGRHLGFVTEGLRSPCHFDAFGDLLLVPDLEARITLLDKSDTPVAQLGDGTNFALRDKPRDQFIPGRFIAPHSACFDASGNIFVVEWVEIGRVTKLKKLS